MSKNEAKPVNHWGDHDLSKLPRKPVAPRLKIADEAEGHNSHVIEGSKVVTPHGTVGKVITGVKNHLGGGTDRMALVQHTHEGKEKKQWFNPNHLKAHVEKSEEGTKEEFLSKPYSSEAQRRWAHTDAGKKALGGEAAVHEWDEATKGKHLPEKLEKGALKNLGTAAAIVGSLAGSPNVAQAPKQPTQQVQSGYSSGKMLNAIKQVESSGGKNTQHEAIPGKMHHGEHAQGEFGLTPVIIRETIKMDPNLKRIHAKAANLHGQDMEHYLQDNPGLEQGIAERHLRRLEHHFGQDPAKIAYAWLNGISGTNKALKNHEDINNHWHVKKVNNAYNSFKK